MLVLIPDMNPIRFYRYNLVPDWTTYFPNPGNVMRGVENIPGVKPVNVYSDFLISKLLSLQLRISTEGTENLTLYKMNETTGVYAVHATVTPVDITPLGWVSEKVNRYDYTPSAAGIYYYESTTAGIRSDKFIVHSELYLKKRLVQVQFVNTENDFMMVFDDNGTSRYTGLAYFTGKLVEGEPSNEISVHKYDRGSILKLRSTPVPVAMLTLCDLHYTDTAKINAIFSCDTLTINGVTYTNSEIGNPEQIQGSDLIKITIKLTQKDYSYGR